MYTALLSGQCPLHMIEFSPEKASLSAQRLLLFCAPTTEIPHTNQAIFIPQFVLLVMKSPQKNEEIASENVIIVGVVHGREVEGG